MLNGAPDDGTWGADVFEGHAIGCNAVSWAPAVQPGSLLVPHAQNTLPGQAPAAPPSVKRFASAGCDNLVRIWGFRDDTQAWVEEDVLDVVVAVEDVDPVSVDIEWDIESVDAVESDMDVWVEEVEEAEVAPE